MKTIREKNINVESVINKGDPYAIEDCFKKILENPSLSDVQKKDAQSLALAYMARMRHNFIDGFSLCTTLAQRGLLSDSQLNPFFNQFYKTCEDCSITNENVPPENHKKHILKSLFSIGAYVDDYRIENWVVTSSIQQAGACSPAVGANWLALGLTRLDRLKNSNNGDLLFDAYEEMSSRVGSPLEQVRLHNEFICKTSVNGAPSWVTKDIISLHLNLIQAMETPEEKIEALLSYKKSLSSTQDKVHSSDFKRLKGEFDKIKNMVMAIINGQDSFDESIYKSILPSFVSEKDPDSILDLYRYLLKDPDLNSAKLITFAYPVVNKNSLTSVSHYFQSGTPGKKGYLDIGYDICQQARKMNSPETRVEHLSQGYRLWSDADPRKQEFEDDLFGYIDELPNIKQKLVWLEKFWSDASSNMSEMHSDDKFIKKIDQLLDDNQTTPMLWLERTGKIFVLNKLSSFYNAKIIQHICDIKDPSSAASLTENMINHVEKMIYDQHCGEQGPEYTKGALLLELKGLVIEKKSPTLPLKEDGRLKRNRVSFKPSYYGLI